jgi:uroporphyrin-III C-methyltransferase/precorrin-2 dehydrogenase/sirohydrochlorin ferrochelatase
MSNTPTEARSANTGKIYFIGSGPGNPDLITVKGANLLAQAEVIITDRLAGDEIIGRYANPDAIIIDVGKQGGNEKSYKQYDINKLLIQFSKLYEKVVRLKGGDIAFFSNVYDELQTLADHNIAYEIVPGITAASGASAFTGVPLTARGFASGVKLLTHFNNSIINKESWKQLAAFKETLVFYMSSNNLASIIEQLIKAGADTSIPFLVIEQATTPNQRVHAFTLQSFPAEPIQFNSPSIVIMGKVAGLHENFAWYKNNSVAGENYFRSVEAASAYLKINPFITRPVEGAQKITENVD